MTTAEAIVWLERAIARERALAVKWSLAGWPSDANYYRRQALKVMRILQRVREATK